jgi:hypothetical protein
VRLYLLWDAGFGSSRGGLYEGVLSEMLSGVLKREKIQKKASPKDAA